MRNTHLPLVGVLLALLTGCAQYSTVSLRRPFYASATEAGNTIAAALNREQREPLLAAGEYLSAAQSASVTLKSNPKDTAALADYNFAVGRLIEAIEQAGLDPWTAPLRISSADGREFILSHQPDPRPQWHPSLYDFTPADQFDVRGKYVTKRQVKPGLGAVLVAVGKEQRKDAAKNFVAQKAYYSVTAVARFTGNRCVIAFEDPLEKEDTRLDGRTYPLAADFTVPLAVMLARENPKRLEAARVFNPDKFAETAHIVRLQPFNPKKTVVIVVHGLADSPATWAPMLNTLRADPAIRQNYQFWYYSYPSGYPYPYSAAIFRRELDAIEKRFQLDHKIVLIGHSMGSLISRLMITDTGDKLWLGQFGKPPSQTNLTPQTKDTLMESLIFRHRPEVGRVIFISGPHRGSDIASNWIGRFASSLVKAPGNLVNIGNEAAKIALSGDSGTLRLKTIPNSVDTLSPNNRFVKNINTIPITPGIPYHSIIGDRGRGGNTDKTRPVSSDGVVPYWSSHLPGAASELIVPSNHSAHQNGQAIDEVARILKLHRK